MKDLKINPAVKRLLTTFLLLAIGFFAYASPTYEATVKNDTLIDAQTYQFDIFIERTGADDFYLSLYDLSFVIGNPAALDGGTLTYSIDNTESDLPAGFEPANVVAILGQWFRVNSPDLTNQGTLIPDAPTLITTVIIENSVDFLVGETLDLEWSFAWPAFTNIYHSPGGNSLEEDVFVQASHVNDLVNPELNNNATIVLFNVTGTGSYCEGAAGLAVGLDGSETDVFYQLMQNGIPLGDPVPGTGAAINFGEQLEGTYTVEAFRLAHYPVVMTGNAVITEDELPIVTIAADQSIPVNTAPTLLTSNVTGGLPPYDYQWFEWDGTDWQLIVGAENDTYDPGVLNENKRYRLEVTDANNCVGVSNEVDISIFGLSNLLVNLVPAALVDPVCEGITYSIGLEDSEPNQWYILFRVRLNDDYEPRYKAVAEGKNEDGGFINWGSFGTPGKYVAYFFVEDAYDRLKTNVDYMLLEDYILDPPAGEPDYPDPLLQTGEFWIIEQPAVRSVTFTGTEGVDYSILPTGQAIFCSGVGSITLVNPEYSPPVTTSPQEDPYEYGEEWNVTYTLYRDGVPYTLDVNGDPVDPIENPNLPELVWNNLHAGTYTVHAVREPCPGIEFPIPGLTIILVDEPKEVEIAAIDDVSTITNTPVILDVSVTYGDIASQDLDPTVMADARITFNPPLPADARIVELSYNSTTVATDVNIGEEDEVLLSEIIGAGAPNPLNGHQMQTDVWTIVVDGVDVAGTYSVTFEALAYYGDYSDGICVYVLDTEAFAVTFGPATVAPLGDMVVCYDADVEFDYEITYPAIINLHPSITNDAKIEVFDDPADLNPKDLTAGTSIEIYFGGAWVYTYTLTGDFNTFYLSALLAGEANPTTAAAQNPLQGHSGTDNWSFAIAGAEPGNYFVDITNFAQLGSVEYPYAGESFALTYVGALGVEVTASGDISTVTGAPVIFDVTVNYGDLASQDIDSSVQVDALITLDDDPMYILPPAGAAVVEILLDGAPYWSGNHLIGGMDEILLSDILGGSGALIDHNGLTHVWTIVVAGLTEVGTLSATIQSIAYIDFTECHSVLDGDQLEITLDDLAITADNPDDVCDGADVESQVVIEYPAILNNPLDITTDAAITVNKDIPAGVEIEWAYNSGADSGSYTFAAQLDAGDEIRLSEIVGDDPTPLQGHDGLTVTWDFVFKGLPVNDYVLTVVPVSILDGADFALGSDPDPVQQSFEVLPLPVATISGPLVVYSGTTHQYEVPVPAGVPAYIWDASPAWVSIADETANPVSVTFTWGPENLGITTLTVEVDNGTCKATGFLEVEVLPNRIAGQVKYYNSQESPMPSPFMTNHDGNLTFPDFFYVALLPEGFDWGTKHPYNDAAAVVKVEEYYGEDGNPLFSDLYYEAAFYFDYNLNPAENYTVAVWDGGYYEEIASGEWSLEGELGKSWTWNNWGGVNATDALIILNMVVDNDVSGNYPHIGWPYTDYSMLIADVNDSDHLTALDALLASRRSIGLLQKFPNNQPNFEVAGLFVDETNFNTNNIFTNSIAPSIFEYTGLSNYLWSTPAKDHAYRQYIKSIDDFSATGNRYLNIYYTAAGDLNASYVPVYGEFKDDTDVQLIVKGKQGVSVGQEVDIPFTFDQFVRLGAMSLGLNYRHDLIEITGTSYGDDFAYFDNNRGILRIGWAELNGIPFNAGDEAAVVTVRVLADIPEGTHLFELDGFTEFADVAAKLIPGVNLYVPALVQDDDVVGITDPQTAMQIKATNFPNPFNNQTTIRYELPEAGKVQLKVFNNIGQLVTTLVSEDQTAGVHEVSISGNDLIGPGVYYYRLIVNGVENHYTTTNSMIMIK